MTGTVVGRRAGHLELSLAGLAASGGAFAPETLADLDGREAFPDEACAALDALGLPSLYVPARFGGDLVALDETCEAVRAVARHDLTVAIAHGKTFLGSVSVWLAGSAEQSGRLAERIASGAAVSWGLTEREHGSDLLAGEVSATRTPGGSWRLDGEKWLINNATRSELICVLARTRPDGGPRGFTLFLVDKEELPQASFTHTPKVRTHGIRGADISGISFHGTPVPASAVVGAEGQGIETVLKALQVTRTTCGALSLGAGDHALDLARGFAAGRTIYGRPLTDLPHVRRELAEVATGLLVAEAALLAGTRTAHSAPEQLSVVSAVTKAFVPETVQRAVDKAAEILGTRAFLTDVYAHGAMAKLDRDHRVVAIFDGTTLVSRGALIAQFPMLARRNDDVRSNAVAFALDEPLPQLDMDGLRLLSPSGCGVVDGLASAVGAAPTVLAELARRLLAEAAAVEAELAQNHRGARDVSTDAFALAERYELVFAGAAALHLWLANPGRHEDPLWREALWVRAALGNVLHRLDGGRPDRAVLDDLADHILASPAPISLLRREDLA